MQKRKRSHQSKKGQILEYLKQFAPWAIVALEAIKLVRLLL